MAAPKKAQPKDPIVGPQKSIEEKQNEFQEAVGSQEPKKRYPGNWVKLSEDELKEAQESGTLKGYNPKTGEGLLNEEG